MKTLLLGFTLLTSSAFASTNLDDLNELTKPPRQGKHCRGLKITEKQKMAIKRTIKKARTSTRGHRGAIMLARKNMMKAMLNPNTTRQEAVAAKAALREASRPVKKVMKRARLHIAFDVLSGEQRVKATKCRMKQRRNRRGGHPRF